MLQKRSALRSRSQNAHVKKSHSGFAESQSIQTFIEVALGMLQTSSAVTFWVFIRVRVRVELQAT